MIIQTNAVPVRSLGATVALPVTSAPQVVSSSSTSWLYYVAGGLLAVAAVWWWMNRSSASGDAAPQVRRRRRTKRIPMLNAMMYAAGAGAGGYLLGKYTS